MSTTLSKRTASYGVFLAGQSVGTLYQRDDYTWFTFTEDYLADPLRAVLGLALEERPKVPYASNLRLPAWFSNLLPEGALRDWIALERGISIDREMELLAQVGVDLPGAVQVIPLEGPFTGSIPDSFNASPEPALDDDVWRFSLAGVSLKFSMLRDGDRLTLPANGIGGNWIVKLPDSRYSDVPINEYAMMKLASLVGIETPAHILLHREQLLDLPDNAWRSNEVLAYAVERFDRPTPESKIHIEDLAQVRNFYPYGMGKYRGSFETVGALVYRRHDLRAVQEFARRIALNVLIANGDAHLKNWSLIYRNPRRPTLSPVYDLVSTELYRTDHRPEDLGLTFGGSRNFDAVNLHTFRKLELTLGLKRGTLVEPVIETTDRVLEAWPQLSTELESYPHLIGPIGQSIDHRSRTLVRNREDT